MKSALIGYTGFVGSNLAAQHKFDDLYNTSNIADIEGKNYDLVVSAGARADKWRINQEAEKDLAEIDELIEHLKKVKTNQFVLISTVDVYKNPKDVNEDTPIDTNGLHAYGLNRYHLEQFVRKYFDGLVVRLPGLFGNGLKKNVIFDFANNNGVERIHYAGLIQYYNLDYLWRDIQTALEHNLKLVNFASEPVRTDVIAKECFGLDNFKNEPEGVKPADYDMQTIHAEVYGKTGSHIYSAQDEIEDIKKFLKQHYQL